MRSLVLGDIVGRVGLSAVTDALPKIVKNHHVDFVIANGENVSKGRGITRKDYCALLDAGVDAITLGNHYHGKWEIDDYIDEADALVRPLNLLHYDLGVGSATFDCNGIPLTVTNLLGTAFMKEEVTSPIVAMQMLLGDVEEGIHIVDYHAESTSEKAMFAYYFDGQVSAVIGTHTHVLTSDERILPKGTAFLSDAGFAGAYQSIIGFEPESVINRLLYGKGERMEIEEDCDTVVNGVLLDINDNTYLAESISTLTLVNGKEVLHGASHL